MPLHLHLIRASEFIRVGAEGHFDLAASKAALATIARACRKRGVQSAIMDLRALHPGPKPVFTPADLLELVNAFHSAGFTHDIHLAILYGSDPYKRARLFAFLSTLHHYSVRAFHNFEEALFWLMEREDARTDAPQAGAEGEVGIPVRHQGPGPRRKLLQKARPRSRAGRSRRRGGNLAKRKGTK